MQIDMMYLPMHDMMLYVPYVFQKLGDKCKDMEACEVTKLFGVEALKLEVSMKA